MADSESARVTHARARVCMHVYVDACPCRRMPLHMSARMASEHVYTHVNAHGPHTASMYLRCGRTRRHPFSEHADGEHRGAAAVPKGRAIRAKVVLDGGATAAGTSRSGAGPSAFAVGTLRAAHTGPRTSSRKLAMRSDRPTLGSAHGALHPRLYIGSVSASPTACPSHARGCGRLGRERSPRYARARASSVGSLGGVRRRLAPGRAHGPRAWSVCLLVM